MSSAIPIEMPSSKAPASILIIDDIPQIHNFLAMHLRSENYTIHRAVTGMEGLEIIHSHHVDLVLLDIGLPDISGFEVLKHVKADPRFSSIPVVILTIRDLTENIVRALELGAFDYVTKPFEPAELRARVKSAIAMKFFQEKLEQSKKQFVTMINGLAEVVFQLTFDGEINFINSTWEEMSGYPVKDSLLVSLYDFLHPEDTAPVRARLQALAEKGEGMTKFEARFLDDEEQVFWGEIKLRTLCDDAGLVTGFTGTLVDITIRKNAQQELELRKERFRLLLENSDNVILVVNETGTIQYASSSITQVLDCLKDKIEGKSFLEFLHPDDQFAAKSALAVSVASIGRGEALELRVVCDDGRYEHCRVVMNNLLLAPPVGGVVITLRHSSEEPSLRGDVFAGEALLAEIREAMHELTKDPGNADVVVRTLVHSAETVEADMLCLVAVGDEGQVAIPLFEWFRDAETSADIISDSLINRWLPRLRHGLTIDEQFSEKTESTALYAPAAIRSALVLPLMLEGVLAGFFCVCHSREAKVWRNIEKYMMEIGASGISMALHLAPGLLHAVKKSGLTTSLFAHKVFPPV